MAKNDGGPALCTKLWGARACGLPAARRQGHQNLCQKHYRWGQMKAHAKRRGKHVPSDPMLFFLTAEATSPTGGMRCPACFREMNWLGGDGQDTVVTLQHDRGGRMRFLCRSCNTRHAAYPNDDFYAIPDGYRLCPGCGCLKALANFVKDKTRWKQKKTYCRECSRKRHAAWVAKNREKYNAKRRAYYHRRITEGRPIPR